MGISVDLVLTSDDPLSGTAARDGVTPTAGATRILAVAQSTASQNGPWLAQTGAWTRPSDYSVDADFVVGQTLFVQSGTLGEYTNWQLQSGSTIAGAKTYAKLTCCSPPAPALVATSNIALTGVVTVDGVASNTLAAGQAVLCVAQTTAAQNGYWLPNASGAWTRPSFYGSDATVEAVLGQASGAALGGILNSGQTFFQFAGDTIAGAKTFVPSRAPARINACEAPWFIVGDGVTDQSTKRDLLLGYAATLPAGCTIEFGRGTFRFSTTGIIPQYTNIVGAGMVVTEFKNMPGAAPFDIWRLDAPLNIGKNGAQTIEKCRVTNTTINAGTPKWVPSSAALALNGHYRSAQSHSHVLKLTTKSGSTAARAPIGELTCSNTAAKMLGSANADGQFLLKVITPGSLGTMQVQLSANAGTAWSTTQNTVAGDYQDFVVDAVIGGSTYGADCRIRLANIPGYSAPTGVLASFTMPAVVVAGSVAGTVTLQLTTGSTDPLFVLKNSGAAWVHIVGAGLMRVESIVDSTHFVASNVGASSAVAPGTVVSAGATMVGVIAPSPRIEVLGTPPADNYIVDVLPVAGPLGRTRTFYYGAAAVAQANKHKNGLAVSVAGGYPAGGIDTTSGAFFDYSIPATSLTLRIHTGILSNNASWMYFTPAAGWTMQAGTTVADGANVWTVVQGPACIRSNGVGNLTLRDVWLDGGAFNFVGNQAEGFSLEGNCVLTSCGTAKVWFTNGDGRFGEGGGFSNNMEIDGNIAGFGDGYGIIHDGGNGLQIGGGYSDSSSPSGWCFLAGLVGGEIVARYIEGVETGLLRNAQCFSRITAGNNCCGLDFGGSYWGSLAANSALDLHFCDGLSFTGVTFGGANYGLTGVSGCTNLNVLGGIHAQGKPIVDAMPLSGQVSCQGFDLRIGLNVCQPASFGNMSTAYNDLTVTRSVYTAVLTANSSISGFVAGYDGQELELVFTGAFALTIKHDATSAAANRTTTESAADVVCATPAAGGFGRCRFRYYAGSVNRWRLLDHT